MANGGKILNWYAALVRTPDAQNCSGFGLVRSIGTHSERSGLNLIKPHICFFQNLSKPDIKTAAEKLAVLPHWGELATGVKPC
jgi:hypothetical protein